MNLVALAILQAALPAPTPAPAPGAIDLLAANKHCDEGAGGDVVVCGDRGGNERYRLRPLPPRPERQLPQAETTIIGDIEAGAALSSEQIGPGLTSNRMMLKLKMPF